ncbi:hypothetical protein SO802_034552 [Lithocarpus litseifolius]|uniref:Uncharacterized protein n=1 Tax=Lithocarpus litseifolius TaxID=425828 RepID=A0AAW2BIU5_9ROSI
MPSSLDLMSFSWPKPTPPSHNSFFTTTRATSPTLLVICTVTNGYGDLLALVKTDCTEKKPKAASNNNKNQAKIYE